MVGEQLAPDPLAPVEQPRYIQLARAVRSAIAQGVLPAGDKLPPERELSRRFSVSRATVRRALVELEEQGCVRAAGTRGWFVASTRQRCSGRHPERTCWSSNESG
jgi:DNA-binding GntR family transcriptional regulator